MLFPAYSRSQSGSTLRPFPKVGGPGRGGEDRQKSKRDGEVRQGVPIPKRPKSVGAGDYCPGIHRATEGKMIAQEKPGRLSGDGGRLEKAGGGRTPLDPPG